jgi:hypothetical protein
VECESVIAGSSHPHVRRAPADTKLEFAFFCRDHAGVASIFISYARSDRDWAFWIAKELQALGYTRASGTRGRRKQDRPRSH